MQTNTQTLPRTARAWCNTKTRLLASLLYLVCLPVYADKPTYYPAQIAGRVLAVPGLELLGHIGILLPKTAEYPEQHLIEVLNEKEVIQINSLKNFKSRSAFWGTRYGIADKTPAANTVIQEALRQRELCPIYTHFAMYYPGRGTARNPKRCAVFRCDTFVRYVFLKAGHDLVKTEGMNLPSILFNAFPKSNHDEVITHQTYRATKLLTAPRSITTVSIEELMGMSMHEFMQTIDVPKANVTPDVLQKTWEFAQNKALDSKKRVLLLDYLGLVGNIDLLNRLIQAYPNESDPDVKHMMLRSTLTLYQLHASDTIPLKTNTHLQAFYQGLLNNPLDNPLHARDLTFAIRGFTTLSNTNTVLKNHKKIDDILRYHAHALPPETRLQLHMMLAFKAPSLETIYIPQILQLLIDTQRVDLQARFQEALNPTAV